MVEKAEEGLEVTTVDWMEVEKVVDLVGDLAEEETVEEMVEDWEVVDLEVAPVGDLEEED